MNANRHRMKNPLNMNFEVVRSILSQGRLAPAGHCFYIVYLRDDFQKRRAVFTVPKTWEDGKTKEEIDEHFISECKKMLEEQK